MADTSTTAGMARFLLPKLPLLFRTAAAYALGLSDTSRKWDLRSEVTIRLIRSFFNEPENTSISKLQRMSVKDPGIKGKIWVAKTALAPPEEDDARRLLLAAVHTLGSGAPCPAPTAKPVEGEWTAYRPDADAATPRPDLSEPEQYARLMRDVKTDLTILYIHGGALYLLDPSSYRPICSRLSKLTGGRCFSVRYRLAPQDPFPAALLDVFTAYLSLLYPPPGSLHEPVPPEKIVVAGDSAGGNLSLALLQLLLQINRSTADGTTSQPEVFSFHSRHLSLPLPLPAGMALTSAWTDLTASMPSLLTNLKFDYLPPLADYDRFHHIEPCQLWPSSPPRIDLYCDGPLLAHPLVSPLAATDWTGSCPVWFGYGEECLVDEGRGVAGRMSAQGVTLEWCEFEAMPHCFAMVLFGTPASRLCYDKWAWFMRTVSGVNKEYQKGVEATRFDQPDVVRTRATYVEAQTLHERSMALSQMSPFTPEEIEWRMNMAQRRKMDAVPPGTGEIIPAKL